MCGLFACINHAANLTSSLDQAAILEAFRWRGPDDQGTWHDAHALLMHRRLAILDLSSHGHQPMRCDQNRYVLVFNGEIYNWQAIRRQLSRKVWHSNTDTETLLYAFQELGPRCLDILNGMFAFVIWDTQTQTVFAARDRVGIKPLYFYHSHNQLMFASEIKTLHAAGVTKQPNPQALSDYLQWGVVDHGRETFFQSIVAVGPGEFATLNLREFKLKTHTYWDAFSASHHQPQIPLSQATDEFKALFEQSIAMQVQADVEVGVCLSGGVDSSVLAACASQHVASNRLKSFTYCFAGGGGEEILAEQTASILGIDNIRCELSHAEVPQFFKKVLFHQESPITSMRVLALHRLYEVCRQQGVTVLLEGAGGDEMGAGYEYYYLPWLLDELRDKPTEQVVQALHQFMQRFNIPAAARFERLVDCLKTTLYPGVSTQDGVSFVASDCVNKAYFTEYTRPRFQGKFDDWLRQLQLIDFQHVVLPKALRYADRASMAASCEARVPMLDHRIAELSFRTAPEARIQNSQQRLFMRTCAEKLLPQAILQRPKQTIVDPQRSWLKQELSDWVGDTLQSRTARKLEFLNVRNIMRAYDDYCTAERPRTSAHLFQYLNIINWYQVFFESGYV